MKNWMVVVAGVVLAVGMTLSEPAQAYAVGVNVNVMAPMQPMMQPMPIQPMPMGVPMVGTHAFPPPFLMPPPMMPRPICGMNPYANPYAMFQQAAAYCAPYLRPYRKHFSFAIRLGAFAFGINTGSMGVY